MNKYVKQALITVGVMFTLNFMPSQVSSLFRGASSSDGGSSDGIAV